MVDATWLQELRKPFSNISSKSIQDILIMYGMLPLPFPISFCLSFAALWVSSLPYLLEWMWGEASVHTMYCTTLIYSSPIPCSVSIWWSTATTAKGCFPLSLTSHLSVLFSYYLAFKWCLPLWSLHLLFLYFLQRTTNSQYFLYNFITRVTLRVAQWCRS